jgi:regulatory protein
MESYSVLVEIIYANRGSKLELEAKGRFKENRPFLNSKTSSVDPSSSQHDQTASDQQISSDNSSYKKNWKPLYLVPHRGLQEVSLYFDFLQSFYVPISFVDRFNLFPGYENTESFWKEMEELASMKLCYDQAVYLLAKKEESAYTLKQKLQLRNHSLVSVKKVIENLQETNYLSDNRYAYQWLKARIRKRPASCRYLIQELSQKGISSELSYDALNSFANEQQIEDLDRFLLKQAKNQLEKRTSQKSKVFSSLQKRGFSYNLIDSILN